MLKTEPRTRYDIAILGTGLTGKLCALAAKRAGLKVALFENEPPADGARPDPRMLAISPANQAYLQTLGLDVEDIVEGQFLGMEIFFGEAPFRTPDLIFGDEPSNRQTLAYLLPAAKLLEAIEAASDFDLFIYEKVVETDGPFKGIMTSHGYVIEAALLAVTSLKHQMSAQLEPEFVVYPQGYKSLALTLPIKAEQAHHGIARQYFLPTGPIGFLPYETHKLSLVWSVNEAYGRLLLKTEQEAFLHEVQVSCGYPYGSIEVLAKPSSFPLTHRVAQKLILPRSVLIGDAVSKIHPLAGQGFNLAIKDIESLMQLLCESRELGLDIGDAGFLEAYERDRQTDHLAFERVTNTLQKLTTQNRMVAQVAKTGAQITNMLGPLKRFLEQQAQGKS